MKIEAVITCVGDKARRMLDFTLPNTVKHFDNVFVVTSTNDTATAEVAAKHGAHAILTSDFALGGFDFNKGAAIRRGVAALEYKEYVCHLDSDIYLPQGYRGVLETELTDIEYFYGSRRTILPTLSDLLLASTGTPLWHYITYPGLYGFNQIWHQQSSIVRGGARYPDSNGVGESDWQWRNLWGDCVNKDTEYTGKLRRISMDVWHLGDPGINGSDAFWR